MDLVGNGCVRQRSAQQRWQYLTKDIHPIPLQLDTASSRTLSQRQGAQWPLFPLCWVARHDLRVLIDPISGKAAPQDIVVSRYVYHICMRMYVYVCVCIICIYTYRYINVCMCICICMYKCMYMYMYMYMYICMYVYVCVCICVYMYMYVYTYVCVCVCVYMYVHEYSTPARTHASTR